MDSVIYATLNTSGLSSTRKRLLLDETCHVNRVSLCAIQESNLHSESYDLPYGHIISSPAASIHAGLGFWVSKCFPLTNMSMFDVVKDSILEFSFFVGDKFYVVYNLHLPHKDAAVMEVLKKWATRLKYWNITIPCIGSISTSVFGDGNNNTACEGDQFPSSSVHSCPSPDCLPSSFLVFGDFNMELERNDTTLTTQWKKLAPRNLIKTILAALDLKFVSLSLFSGSTYATRGRAIIDYICLPLKWHSGIHSMNVVSSIQSDHAMVLVVVFAESGYFKPPYWRFKNQLLAHKPFVTSMSTFLKNKVSTFPSDAASFVAWWDHLKAEIMSVSKRCWSELSLSVKKNLSSNYDGRFLNSDARQPCMTSQTISIPSLIRFIKKDNGEIITDASEISMVLADYYSVLYAKSKASLPPGDMNFGMNMVINQPEDFQKSSMDSLFSVNELHSAAIKMNLGKAPGIDGITIEFYLKFWSFLGHLISLWFKHTLTLKELRGYASYAVVTLVSKQGDPRRLSNWRPISLLTVDLKIILKAISVRILPLISSVISKNQYALPGSTVFSPLSVVRDIISLQNKNKKALWILSLDMQRAFDNVSHEFLFHLLDVIKLPRILVEAIKTTYSNFSCVVKNGSTLSPPFPYLKGVRQGDPTSTILFSLVCQPLINAFSLAMFHEGFILPDGDKILLTNYADDMTLFLQNYSSIDIVVKVFKIIADYSGAIINLDKSVMLGINIPLSLRDQIGSKVSSISISYDAIKILGVSFTPNLKIHTVQWNAKFDATRQFIEANWHFLISRTYFYRAQWVKIRVWPRWSHLFKVLQPSMMQVKQLSDLFTEVIWLSGRHWLSLDLISAPVSLGGLDAIVLSEKIEVLRIMMLARLCCVDPGSHVFKLAILILNSYASLKFGMDLLHSRVEKNELSLLPPVYAAAFRA